MSDKFERFFAWAMPSIPSRDKILAKLVELKAEKEQPFEVPAVCPLCHSELVVKVDPEKL